MPTKNNQEQIRVLRHPDIGGVELVLAKNTVRQVRMHAHSSFCLGLVLAGTKRLQARGCEKILREGDIFHIPAGLAHACGPGPEGRCSYMVICLSSGWHSPIVSLVFLSDIGTLVRQLILVYELFQKSGDLPNVLRELKMLLAAINGLGNAREATGHSPGEERVIRRLEECMVQQPDRSLPVPELATLVDWSSGHLSRVFTKVKGLPPHAYQNLLRIQAAKRYLLRGEGPCSTALRTGFADQSHFNRVFKRLTGLRPSEYVGA